MAKKLVNRDQLDHVWVSSKQGERKKETRRRNGTLMQLNAKDYDMVDQNGVVVELAGRRTDAPLFDLTFTDEGDDYVVDVEAYDLFSNADDDSLNSSLTSDEFLSDMHDPANYAPFLSQENVAPTATAVQKSLGTEPRTHLPALTYSPSRYQLHRFAGDMQCVLEAFSKPDVLLSVQRVADAYIDRNPLEGSVEQFLDKSDFFLALLDSFISPGQNFVLIVWLLVMNHHLNAQKGRYLVEAAIIADQLKDANPSMRVRNACKWSDANIDCLWNKMAA